MKKGQFYLIAAVVIIVVLFGLTAATNYLYKKPDLVSYYDISRELGTESEQIINYGIANDDAEIDEILLNYSKIYAEQIKQSEDSDFYFIYGDETSIKVIALTEQNIGSISLNFGGDPINIPITEYGAESEDFDVEGDNVMVDIGGTNYPFDIKEGQNFFFIVKAPSLQEIQS